MVISGIGRDVALRMEGEDRNAFESGLADDSAVALRMEGEDRNVYLFRVGEGIRVALRMEGEDRNMFNARAHSASVCRPPYGGRG